MGAILVVKYTVLEIVLQSPKHVSQKQVELDGDRLLLRPLQRHGTRLSVVSHRGMPVCSPLLLFIVVIVE